MQYREDLTEEEMQSFLADLAALDEAYAQAWIDRMDAEEFETEADLYRYWGQP